MSQEWETVLAEVRETYHPPPKAPTAEMWEAIEGDIARRSDHVVELSQRRAIRAERRPSFAGWGIAAAAVLVLGIGIGRSSVAPGAAEPSVAAAVAASDRGLDFAAHDYLGRSEAVLTMVRADARAGRIDPLTAEWAGQLLGETRLLIDAGAGEAAPVEGLLLDLELILMQIVGLTEDSADERARTELELTLRGIEEGEVLPRIHAVLPSGSGT